MSIMFPEKYVADYSTFLVKLAWTIEIIAVLIGFTISIVVSVSAFQSYADDKSVGLLSGFSAVMVAGLPFLLIAVVELCKIPLTFAFMSVKNVFWRGLFLLFVLFLCLITFETMLNGFERNFSNLNRAIDIRKNDIENVDSEIVLLNRRKQHVQKFTEEELLAEISGTQHKIDLSFSDMVGQINKSTRRILSTINDSFEEPLKAEIHRLMDVRDGYYNDWSAEKATLEERFSVLLLGNISGSQDERGRLLDELNILKDDMQLAMKDANFFTRDGHERKYRSLIKEKERQLSQITVGYLGAGAIQKQSLMEEQLKQQMEFVNQKYQGRVDDLNERIMGLKQEITDRHQKNASLRSSVVSKSAKDKARFATIKKDSTADLNSFQEGKLAELEVITDQTFKLDEKIFLLHNIQRKSQSEINHLINQNQVYRMAMYAYGKQSATDVSRRMVGVVGLFWFGSLALIASVTGVMLALAGFYLRRLLENDVEPVHI